MTDWIEKTQRMARLARGRDLSSDEINVEMVKLSPVDRIRELETLEAEIAGRDMTLDEAVKTHSLRSKLLSTHRRLRAIGR